MPVLFRELVNGNRHPTIIKRIHKPVLKRGMLALWTRTWLLLNCLAVLLL